MAKKKDETALVAVEPMEVEVLPPQSGAVGEFLLLELRQGRSRERSNDRGDGTSGVFLHGGLPGVGSATIQS